MAMRERVRPKAPSLANWLDRAVAYVSPVAGARRMSARASLHAAEAARERFARIEGAEKSDTRGGKWLISRLSPDSQLELDLQTVRDRSRDLYQNDAIGGVVDSKVNHIVGTGHTAQARVRESAEIPAAIVDRLNQSIEWLYERWAKKVDVSGQRSLWQVCRLAARHQEFDGESFTVFSDVGDADSPIPLRLQVIDPERVETPPKEAGNPRVRLGIKTDAKGRVVSYYVRKTHPGDTKQVNLEYDEIPAERMLHVFEPWFAGQSRGLPFMVRAMQRSKDAKDYDDSMILKAQVEACFTAFVEQPIASYDAAAAASTGTSANGRPMEDLVPGTVRYLAPGEKITFGAPTSPGNGFTGFMEWCYGRIAAAIAWPYEMVTRRWGGLSFAAGRIVLHDAKLTTQVGQKLLREMWLSRVWDRMVEEGVIVGEIDVDPSLYASHRDAINRHEWIPPRWDYALNPGEEVDADIAELSAELATFEEKLGKRGHDLESFIAARQRERRLFAAAGLEPQLNSQPQPVQPGQATQDQQAPELIGGVT